MSSAVKTRNRSQPLSEILSREICGIKDSGLFRSIKTVEAVDGARIKIAGKWLVCWCSNDYLGLSQHPKVIESSYRAARLFGVGSRASRLLAGSTAIHSKLEESLASFFGAQDSVVFPSGYLTNLGTIPSLVGDKDIIFADRLSHASLIDACRASKAEFKVFMHNDVSHLRKLLDRYAHFRRRLIVTEGVFSMDGDSSPLKELLDLAKLYDAWVYLDDAHGAFVMGDSGRGSAEEANVTGDDNLIYMATLGKSLGSQGGFIVGKKSLTDFLKNRSRTFIYSTSLAVPAAAAALESIKILKHDSSFRVALKKNSNHVHREFAKLCLDEFKTINEKGQNHIIPVIIGSSNRTISVSQKLFKNKIFSPAIRPPTVAPDSARLRISVSALHTASHIKDLVSALSKALLS